MTDRRTRQHIFHGNINLLQGRWKVEIKYSSEGENKCIKDFVWKSEGKGETGRPKRCWEDDIRWVVMNEDERSDVDSSGLG
jgi:hypothetical protein